jgi:hypothetical protein
MKSNRIMIKTAEIFRLLTRRDYRKNHRANKLIEAYFKNRGYDWSFAIRKAWAGYDKNCKKGEPRVSRAHYEVGPGGRISIVLQGDRDQHLGTYHVGDQIVLTKVQNSQVEK